MKIETLEVAGFAAAFSALRLPFGKEVRSRIEGHQLDTIVEETSRALLKFMDRPGRWFEFTEYLPVVSDVCVDGLATCIEAEIVIRTTTRIASVCISGLALKHPFGFDGVRTAEVDVRSDVL